MSTTVTMSNYLDLAFAATPIIAGIAGALIRSALVKHGYKTDVYDAAAQAAGAGYAFLAKNKLNVSDPGVFEQAVRIGVAAMVQAPAIQQKMTSLGLDQSHATAAVTGELGKLLANDPSVSVGTSSATAIVADLQQGVLDIATKS